MTMRPQLRGLSPSLRNPDSAGTAFQQRVWWALEVIPVGETASYAEIAWRFGYPRRYARSPPPVSRTNSRSPSPVTVSTALMVLIRGMRGVEPQRIRLDRDRCRNR